MNRKERTAAAIRHNRPDRTPKGDLAIEGRLMRELSEMGGYAGDDPLIRNLIACQFLDADLAHIHEYPVTAISTDVEGRPIFRGAFGEEFVCGEYGHKLLKPAIAEPDEAFDYTPPSPDCAVYDKFEFFKRESDFFLSAQVMGPVSSLDWTLDMQEMLVWCLTDEDAMVELARKMTNFEVERAKGFLDRGADMILIGDDIAYNSGPFLPPRSMEKIAWPFYTDMIRRIKAHRDVPVFLHTDGNINDLLPHIAACGFNGLQSLQPSAGMDIAAVKRQYGKRLCLMGNLDLDHLMTFGTPEEVAAQTRWLCENIGADGGFILSTCNILTDAVPAANALAMYRTVNAKNI